MTHGLLHKHKNLQKKQSMMDFTSSLYLGMQHNSTEISAWGQLSSGVPAALFEPAQSKLLGSLIANNQGLESGFVAPSTLHIYHDLYSLLSKQWVTVFIDENVYPTSEYNIEKLFLKNIPVIRFRHLDAANLQKLVIAKTRKYSKPVVITDGWCPQCGRAAPLNIYTAILDHFGGYIIVDDTQGLGIFGKKNGKEIYGTGGGGILKWLNVNSHNTISITSLAKAFGVPVAVISSTKSFITAFKNNSQTTVYSSPASSVHINAGLQALHTNSIIGDCRRQRLFKNITLVKNILNEKGIKTGGGIFPVQSLNFRNPHTANIVFEKLSKRGIKTVLTTGHDRHIQTICFVICYQHNIDELKKLSCSLQHILCAANIRWDK